ncbi:Amino-acid acetyltransferase, mitochondrial [Coemansia thaxteri]|uniref:Amino-acid acetyltransferase, mitochondrial n=1 Tax=Coemansia thaxteri TaxID=2663907 RepID=A0A9W8BG65_9FUNG|nr:Amino-acid acetyltransferase, mitochondrial [Coemansia thaxteri]KAJ2008914.1 Amino-acid acetyltransferase, mitochondrial [Coemansia thaxteri]KAJ2473530.1 Amino-acid acetyltransferase, mitochondrial [Coemansia sp. RSA 2322]KAJ2487915.1 Amino-acid acetyltransferase, mitochondrial [Coemansia sp. RSA 2320]
MLARTSLHCRAVSRTFTASLSNSTAPPAVGKGSLEQQRSRERELILNVLSTVPSPREARKFVDSVRGRETLRSRREFEERQAQLAGKTTKLLAEVVPGEFLHLHNTTPIVGEQQGSLVAALVCLDSSVSPKAIDSAGKLVAQMQRIGVAPIVLISASSEEDRGHCGVVARTHALADAVEREGGRARPVCEGIFTGNGGEAAADSELIWAALAQDMAPIIAPLLLRDHDSKYQVRQLNDTAPALARALMTPRRQSREQGTGGLLHVARLILLGQAAGIAGPTGSELLRLVNLEEDYAGLTGNTEAGAALGLMRTCLQTLAPTAAGIVAAAHGDPSVVIKGLISERPSAANGVGRFSLLRHGFRIQRHTTLATCDRERLQRLLERSFGRRLDSARYFSRLEECAGGIEVIVAGDYQGAVIVTYEKMGLGRVLPYLDKFAVLPEEQGTGMADILWAQLRAACPSCLWRSRSDNAVNRWYFDRSHGHARQTNDGEGGTKWVFFWYRGSDGLGQRGLTPEDVHEGIGVAEGIRASFI